MDVPSSSTEARPGEEKYVKDFDEAEHIAYAEKPFRDEAVLLDKMADDNYEHIADLQTTDMKVLSNQTPKEATDRGHLATHVRDKMTHLHLAADVSRRQAEYAGDQAQKEYHAAQK